YVGADPQRLRQLHRALRPFWRSVLSRGQLLRVETRFHAAQLLVAAGDRRSRLRAAREARKLHAEGVAYPRSLALLIDAALARQAGDRAAARDYLEAAAAGLRQNGRHLHVDGAR